MKAEVVELMVSLNALAWPEGGTVEVTAVPEVTPEEAEGSEVRDVDGVEDGVAMKAATKIYI